MHEFSAAFTGSAHADRSLVPSARFGSALHRERTRRDETVTAVARNSGGSFLPDSLIAIERGDTALADDDVVALAELYGLPARSLPRPSEVEFVLDRSTGVRPGAYLASDADDVPPDALVARLVALSVLVGLDATTGPHGVGAVADALDQPLSEAVELMARVMADRSEDLTSLIATIETRVVVPEVGVLVADTPIGSLMMVGRRTPSTFGPATDVAADGRSGFPAAAPLADWLRIVEV